LVPRAVVSCYALILRGNGARAGVKDIINLSLNLLIRDAALVELLLCWPFKSQILIAEFLLVID
jgi:hypothetical protein